MSLRVACHQPNYAPWCGFFAKLAAADVLVVLDDVQLPLGRSYVTRTAILGAEGAAEPAWLSIPAVRAAGQRICDVRFADAGWARRHLATLRARYGRAPCFREVFERLEPVFGDETLTGPAARLFRFNLRLVETVLAYLGLERPLVLASSTGIPEQPGGGARLLALVRSQGGTVYVSGPSGLRYQDPAEFAAAGVSVEVRTYTPRPYEQGRAGFVAGLSILDLLFQQGRRSVDWLR